jgi:iron complex outermembrane receptor protein
MNVKTMKTTLLLGCASLMTLAAIQPALAEDQIETVMVTAERRAENQQDVPISTSTLSGDDLSVVFQSGEDIKALAAHVPSLYAESSNGRAAPRFYIRGPATPISTWPPPSPSRSSWMTW